MDQTKKLILSALLIVVAAGLFYWQLKPAPQVEETQDQFRTTTQAKALENIFTKVGSGKKWTDASLWINAKAASIYGKVADKLFTATPSMDNVKILDYGTNKQNEDAPFLVLQAPTSEFCFQVEFKPKGGNDKSGELVMDNILESQVKAQDYKK